MKSSLLAFTVILFLNAASLVFSACDPPKCACTLEKDPGPCHGYFEQYFFNLTSGQCEKFVYGGCQGNGNRFATLEACENTCTCLFPTETGPCKASIPRYHFNYCTQKCEEFTYGGCDGNPNNFETKKACYKTCKPRIGLPKICYLPKKVGPCKARILRFYYNKDTKQCESFYYGGCKGNKNNFKSPKQCNRVCHCKKLFKTIKSECVCKNRAIAGRSLKIGFRPKCFSSEKNCQQRVELLHRK